MGAVEEREHTVNVFLAVDAGEDAELAVALEELDGAALVSYEAVFGTVDVFD